MNSLRTFRIVAILEATSFLLLLVAAVLKRTADAEIGVTILGPIHGALFLAYVLLALYLRPDQGWSTRDDAADPARRRDAVRRLRRRPLAHIVFPIA